MSVPRRRFVLVDKLYRRLWLPIPIVFLLGWILLTIPALNGTGLEGGGSPALFVAFNLGMVVFGSALAVLVLGLIRRLADLFRDRPLLRRSVVGGAITGLYLLALVSGLGYAFAASWAYNH